MPYEDKKSGPVTMTQLRAEPGEYVRAVVNHGELFTVMRSGKPVATLGPIEGEDQDCLDLARAITPEQLRGGGY